jgi:hypothetical protein
MEKKSTKKKTINKKNKYVTKNTYELMFGNESPNQKNKGNHFPISSQGATINGVRVF